MSNDSILVSSAMAEEKGWVSPSSRYLRSVTILFGLSLFFLSLHVIDDALTTGEPAASGVSIPAFLFYAGLICFIIPPLGLIFARRGYGIGFVVVTFYALQAMYGAGLNHVRHMFGDFSGSQILRHCCQRSAFTLATFAGMASGQC